jgi:phosphoadenosine phosphosulfate reductase
MNAVSARRLLEDPAARAEAEAALAGLDAAGRVEWALAQLPGRHVLTSSFGIQAAVLLHLVSRIAPDIPVVFVDTGYLFPETYRYADLLAERLRLHLVVARPRLSPAWLEARHGRLWEKGLSGLEAYHRMMKIEPLERAFAELGVGTWFTGLRRAQSRSRQGLRILLAEEGRFKLNPLADWSDQEIEDYFVAHDLPEHPLRAQGYVSVGDRHTSAPLAPGQRPEETRFFGIRRECGIHRELAAAEAAMRGSERPTAPG